MLQVHFYEYSPDQPDEQFRFAVIAARQNGQWVFCRHRARQTWECPGGHREAGEAIESAARRELWEETGAEEFSIAPVCVYSVEQNGSETKGVLFLAEITRRGQLPPLEIAEVRLFDAPPVDPLVWTYPAIQPLLLKRVERFLTNQR